MKKPLPQRCSRTRLRLFGIVLSTAVVAACQFSFPLGGAAAPIETGVATFVDQFDGPTGSPPNPDYWTADVGGTGRRNDELQYYTNSGNSFLDGAGNLEIEADRAVELHDCWYGACDFVSGKVTTKYRFSQRYGLFEARIKAPVGKGLWGGFWLLGIDLDEVGFPEAGEIDIFEVLGDRPRDIEQHVQAPGLRWGEEHVLPAGQSFADWHTYAVRWTPDLIEWLVDGQPTRTITKAEAEAEAGQSWVFDHPFFILLNLSVGGEWPGPPDDETVFPSRMLVDYVRVHALPTE